MFVVSSSLCVLPLAWPISLFPAWGKKCILYAQTTRSIRVRSMRWFRCGAVFCTAVEAVPIRNSQRTRDVAIEAMNFSDPLPPHVFHLDVPFRFATSTPGSHSLIQLGANPAMLEQLLMEMFVPDTTQVLGFAG